MCISKYSEKEDLKLYFLDLKFKMVPVRMSLMQVVISARVSRWPQSLIASAWKVMDGRLLILVLDNFC